MSSPFLDHVRATARLKHLSYRTECTYVQTIKRFFLFHQKRLFGSCRGKHLFSTLVLQHQKAMRQSRFMADSTEKIGRTLPGLPDAVNPDSLPRQFSESPKNVIRHLWVRQKSMPI